MRRSAPALKFCSRVVLGFVFLFLGFIAPCADCFAAKPAAAHKCCPAQQSESTSDHCGKAKATSPCCAGFSQAFAGVESKADTLPRLEVGLLPAHYVADLSGANKHTPQISARANPISDLPRLSNLKPRAPPAKA